jgi:hypothetical protein
VPVAGGPGSLFSQSPCSLTISPGGKGAAAGADSDVAEAMWDPGLGIVFDEQEEGAFIRSLPGLRHGRGNCLV